MAFVYRGVHAKHPALALAREGIVRPGNPDGTLTAEEHNLGRGLAGSPYTSWSHRREVAVLFAKSSGLGGVLLRLPTGAPKPQDPWRWEWSPDEYNEQEVLLRGIRSGAEVDTLE